MVQNDLIVLSKHLRLLPKPTITSCLPIQFVVIIIIIIIIVVVVVVVVTIVAVIVVTVIVTVIVGQVRTERNLNKGAALTNLRAQRDKSQHEKASE
jgi:c-di-AMP phosphodiesterase-like protein